MPSYKDLLYVQGDYYYWPKFSSVKLSEHFTTDEFSCRCRHTDCNEQRIAVELVDALEDVRKELGASIEITSGFRCRKHQTDLYAGGTVETVLKSTHELGDAADIKTRLMTNLFNVAKKYFLAIGIAPTFLHVDLRHDKVRRWHYTK